MTYQFARVDLSKTNYTPTVGWQYINKQNDDDLAQL